MVRDTGANAQPSIDCGECKVRVTAAQLQPLVAGLLDLINEAGGHNALLEKK